MKKIIFVFFSAILLAGAARAALAPFYQSSREIQDILEMRELYETFGDEREIQSIVRNKSGYEIKGENCRIQVDLKYVPTGPMIGRADYRLKIGNKNCKP